MVELNNIFESGKNLVDKNADSCLINDRTIVNCILIFLICFCARPDIDYY